MKAKAGMKHEKYILFPDSTHTSRFLLFFSIVIPSAGASPPPPPPPHTGLPRVLLSRPRLRWSVHIFQDVRATLTPNGYIFSEIRDINSKKKIALLVYGNGKKGGKYVSRPARAAFLGERVVRLHSIKHAYKRAGKPSF